MRRKFFNPIDPINDANDITFTALDKVPDIEGAFNVTQVYFCIQPDGSNKCKNTRSDYDLAPLVGSNYKITLQGGLKVVPGTQGKSYTLKPGKNVIKFYARDNSNNLEIVKEDFFFVDVFPPKVDLSIVTRP